MMGPPWGFYYFPTARSELWLEVFGEDGRRLFDFWATGAAFRVAGDYLEPTGKKQLPFEYHIWTSPPVNCTE